MTSPLQLQKWALELRELLTRAVEAVEDRTHNASIDASRQLDRQAELIAQLTRVADVQPELVAQLRRIADVLEADHRGKISAVQHLLDKLSLAGDGKR